MSVLGGGGSGPPYTGQEEEDGVDCSPAGLQQDMMAAATHPAGLQQDMMTAATQLQEQYTCLKKIKTGLHLNEILTWIFIDFKIRYLYVWYSGSSAN